jgi:CBS domain containing-hemolysin-like protein
VSGIVTTKISFLVLLLLCSGFFSGSETSLFSLGRVERYRIREEKKTFISRCLQALLDRPRRLIVTVLIGNELVNITISSLSASLTQDAPLAWIARGSIDPLLMKTMIATAVCFPLLLVFGEIMPKTLALANPRRFARAAAVPLRLFYSLITPIRWVLASLSNGIVWLLFREPPIADAPITEEEFRDLVDKSNAGGVLWEAEREFIHNIFDFGETRVSEVMTPRTDMFCLQADQSLEEILQVIEEQHYSRIPAYEEDKDDITGILYCKDLLGLLADPGKRQEWNLRALLRKPYFIPQTKKASDLFREFRFNRIHLAIVVDEYGGVAGLVTMEDLLEELFGDILDDYDPEEPQPRQLDENTMLIPARMPIEDFNHLAGLEFPVEEYDTMGGLVFGLFGKLPSPDAKVSFMGCTFTVEKMEGTRILELRVEKHPDQMAPQAEGAYEAPAEAEPGGGADGDA